MSPEATSLCGWEYSCLEEARGLAGEAYSEISLRYIHDGFFFFPLKPNRPSGEVKPEQLELGPEHGGDEGGPHYLVGAVCREARQAFLNRFPQTMAVYLERGPDDSVEYSPYRLVRFNGARDVLVARTCKSHTVFFLVPFSTNTPVVLPSSSASVGPDWGYSGTCFMNTDSRGILTPDDGRDVRRVQGGPAVPAAAADVCQFPCGVDVVPEFDLRRHGTAL